jgi:hypothetical protein
MENDM